VKKKLMIPTQHKAKLPRGLSYPIGAEAISEALAGAPHVESLALAFRDQAIWPASEFRRVVAQRLPYAILAADYRPALKGGYGAPHYLIESGWYEEKWELQVNAVASDLRQLASRLLRERGLPAVAQWLRSSQRAGWCTRSQWLALEFDPTGETLVARESSGA
jgi:hypothetical protein